MDLLKPGPKIEGWLPLSLMQRHRGGGVREVKWTRALERQYLVTLLTGDITQSSV